MTDYRGQLFGNYRLTRFLGEGGFATVYLGEHIHLHTHSAIKILTTKIVNEDVEQFRHEAYLLAHLSHPNIVRVFDFGLEERERLPFLVMQYASHGTLRQRHPKGNIVPLEAVLSYVQQVAAALHYAHSNRIIHRDVKPENMLIGDQNEILLSDFGIALLAQTAQKTQELIGTVSYMSPEQIQGKPQPASDQYSLGIVVYEWLSGTCPFRGSFLEVCTQHMMAPLPPLHQRVPGISPEVEQVVARALAKDPKERFSSIQAFATALTEAAQGRTQGNVYVSFTPQAASRTSSNASVAFTPNATTEQVQSQERGVRYTPQEQIYASQNTPRPPQELSPSTSKKGRRGLLTGIIAAVLILILGSGGTFAALTISNHAHMLASATATATTRLATATTTSAANHQATATATAALLTSGADFTVQSPKLSNMTLVSNDSQFNTDHAILAPGQQVVIAFTSQPNTKSVFLTIRALVSQAGPNNAGFSPINLFCNGQVVVSNYTMPGNGYTANTTSIQIPFQQLTATNNQLRLLVAPEAKTFFWLYNLQVVQST